MGLKYYTREIVDKGQETVEVIYIGVVFCCRQLQSEES